MPGILKVSYAALGTNGQYEIFIYLRGAFNKFLDFFGMDTFINRTHKKL